MLTKFKFLFVNFVILNITSSRQRGRPFLRHQGRLPNTTKNYFLKLKIGRRNKNQNDEIVTIFIVLDVILLKIIF